MSTTVWNDNVARFATTRETRQRELDNIARWTAEETDKVLDRFEEDLAEARRWVTRDHDALDDHAADLAWSQILTEEACLTVMIRLHDLGVTQ